MAFTDCDEFKAIKTLKGRRAPRCDELQFRAKMTVRGAVFEISLNTEWGRKGTLQNKKLAS